MKTTALAILIIVSLICFGLLPKARAFDQAGPDTALPGGNTADGQLALASLTSGLYNSAFGIYSLLSLTDGNFCTGVGAGTLLVNAAGENTAIGAGALLSNSTGLQNTACGAFALFSSTQSSFNTADGYKALFNNTTGGENTALGRAALFNNTSGNHNIAIGVSAGQNLTAGDNNIDIGNAGETGESNTIRIGASQDRTFIAGIRGVEPPVGVLLPVQIDLNGQLGTTASSRRFKREINPMDKVSEAILALNPVTFHYKNDATNTPQFGLIAEEVAAVNPNLIVRNTKGDVYSVRYEAVNAMLLNEFLKEHRKVEEQDNRLQQQEATIARLQKQIEALAAGLQRVSDQLELSKFVPQTVADTH